MVEVADLPRSRRPGILVHELALLAIAFGTLGALVTRAGPGRPTTVEAGMAALLYGGCIWVFRNGGEFRQKMRLAAAYAFTLWFYLSISRITSALGTLTWDDTLLALDRRFLGETPAVFCQAFMHSWLTDLLSVCYLSYLVYLHVAVMYSLWQPLTGALYLGVPLYSAFAIGFLGYLLVPAVGPGLAFPELFSRHFTGGLLTQFNSWVVGHGSSRYDVFPSLHILITCVLLNHDWRRMRWRFAVMLLPSVGMAAATLYLRYHYAVDLLAGGVLFLGSRWAFSNTW